MFECLPWHLQQAMNRSPVEHAHCSVCGPTSIYLWPSTQKGTIRRVCINKLRESWQDHRQRLRREQGLPELFSKPRHLLSQIDPQNMRANCSVCGPTDIRKSRGKYYYCYTKKRKYATDYRRSQGIPPYEPNPAHHRLSQIDLENRTAVCSRCGPIRIYTVKQGNGIASRCCNAHRDRSSALRQSS
jgi:hypothetical protein